MIEKICSTCKISKSMDSYHVKARRCKICAIAASKKSYELNKKNILEKNKTVDVKEHKNALRRENYKQNSTKILDRNHVWKNENKEKVALCLSNWQKNNPGKINAIIARRKAAKLQRTPKWLTDFDKLKIKCIYSIAAMLTRENNEPWHVDHIIPLQGKTVSGLHVPSNLRPMREIENKTKSNIYEVV